MWKQKQKKMKNEKCVGKSEPKVIFKQNNKNKYIHFVAILFG